MMHPERKPMSNEPQELDPKVDFTVLDEAVKKVLAYKPEKNREGKVNGGKARAESMTPGGTVGVSEDSS